MSILPAAGSKLRWCSGIADSHMLQSARGRGFDIQKRWEIETAFRAMKSSGFNIEDTHMRDMDTHRKTCRDGLHGSCMGVSRW